MRLVSIEQQPHLVHLIRTVVALDEDIVLAIRMPATYAVEIFRFPSVGTSGSLNCLSGFCRADIRRLVRLWEAVAIKSTRLSTPRTKLTTVSNFSLCIITR